MSTVGQRIRAAREAKGWTQEQAARELGVSLMTVSRWERGEHDPTRHLSTIAGVYEKSVDWLLTGAEAIGVELDSSVSPYAEFERFIADERDAGRPISELHTTALRSARFNGGEAAATYRMAEVIVSELRAAERGKGSAKQRVRPGS